MVCYQYTCNVGEIMKRTSKQLKQIWPKLVLSIQLNKIKLIKQQKAAAIYMTFCSYHYTDMRWMRGYQNRFSACGIPRTCVRSSWCWCKISNIVWREGVRGREERRMGSRRRNCYRGFVNKLQIDTPKCSYNHTSFDKAPSTIFWRAY